MRKLKYVVVSEAAQKNVIGGFKAKGDGESPKVSVDVLEMTPHEAASVANKTTKVAPVMPVMLVKPMAKDASPAIPGNGVAWGVEAVGAVSSPFDGDGVVVAVLDTGIEKGHEAFNDPRLEIVGRNFTSEVDEDVHGHGTHCAGTIFGRPVGGTRIGVAPGVKKALIGKVLGDNGGGSAQIAQAIHWALDGGANVISMSLGIDFPGFVKYLEEEEGLPTQPAVSLALEGYRANILLFEAMASLVRRGNAFLQPTLLFAAAGNESERPAYTIAVSPPAISEGFVSVAALAKTDQGYVVAPFSNTGARLAAPGVDIVSAGLGGGLTSMSGTSMATPHVAGVAALWAQKLKGGGMLNVASFQDKLAGSTTMAGMAPGMSLNDVGSGTVLAPQA